VTRVTEFPARIVRRTGAGRAFALAALAAATTALGACSAGQITQTAYMATAVPGVNQTFAVADGNGTESGSVSIRDLSVAFDNPKGYPKGGSAKLQVGIFNDTTAELKVTVTAPGAASAVTLGSGGTAAAASPAPSSASPSASASAAPVTSGSASPSTTASAAASPATVTIPSGTYVVFSRDSSTTLTLQGLTTDIKPGDLVRSVAFKFDLGSGLQVTEAPTKAAATVETPSPTPPAESCVFSDGQAVCRVPVTNPTLEQPRVKVSIGGEGE
jgi:hypothetical protein